MSFTHEETLLLRAETLEPIRRLVFLGDERLENHVKELLCNCRVNPG